MEEATLVLELMLLLASMPMCRRVHLLTSRAKRSARKDGLLDTKQEGASKFENCIYFRVISNSPITIHEETISLNLSPLLNSTRKPMPRMFGIE